MKSMKKLVLVGLVLLASVMVLVGCDTPLEPVDNVNMTPTPESKAQPEPETPKYTVTFDKGDTTDEVFLPPAFKVKADTVLSAEQLMDMSDSANYSFVGWYDGEIEAKAGIYKVTGNVTLTAKWRQKSKTASVTMSIVDNKVVLHCSISNAKIYYTTDGTRPTEDSTEYIEPIEITKYTSIKTIAKAEGYGVSLINTYDIFVISFDANGGSFEDDSSSKKQIVRQSTKATEPSRPLNENQFFTGWYDSESDKPYDFNTNVLKEYNLYAKWGDPVASVTTGNNDVKFGLFSDALACAMDTEGSTLTLLQDVNNNFSVSINGEFTLDLNNHALIYSSITVSSSTILTITDTSDEGNGYVHCSRSPFYNYGELMLLDGDIQSAKHAIDNSGKLTINGGNVYSRHYDGIYNGATGTVTVENGLITSDSENGVDNNGTLTVSGGTITGAGGNRSGVDNDGTLTVSGGTITGVGENGRGVANFGTLTVSGGTITGTGQYGVGVENDGTLTVSGGTITGTEDGSDGVFNDSTGILSVSGDAVISGKDDGIHNRGTLTISGGNITSDNRGVNNFINGEVTVSGGTINGGEYSVYSSSLFKLYGDPTITGTSFFRGSISLVGPLTGEGSYHVDLMGYGNGTVVVVGDKLTAESDVYKITEADAEKFTGIFDSESGKFLELNQEENALVIQQNN